MKQRRFRMIAMKRKQTSRIGKRCKGFWPGCIVCACYHFLDAYGRYPKDFQEAVYYQETLGGRI